MTDKTTVTHKDKEVLRVISRLCIIKGEGSFALEAEILDKCMVSNEEAKISIDTLKRFEWIKQASQQSGECYYRPTLKGIGWFDADREK